MTTRGMLIAIGSPHARRGPLWDAFKRYFRADGDPLTMVVKASSREMNATLPQADIDLEMEKDESTALSEYYAEFRQDIEDFVSIEVVDAGHYAGQV
jgi:hypothetical protein